MSVVKFVLLVIGLSTVAVAQRKTFFQSCGGTEIKSFGISPCNNDDEEPCIIEKGSTVKVDIEFVANQDSEKARHGVKTRLSNGIQTGNFPKLKTDGCKWQNITCPVKKGDTQYYHVDLNIVLFFPSVTANATFTLTGVTGIMMCATTPIRVIPKT